YIFFFFFFSSRRRHTRSYGDWSSDVCSSDLWIPDRFQDVDDWKFSFVHIDTDWPEPTSESLAFFYPRIEAGGIIVCDDYGQSPRSEERRVGKECRSRWWP